MLLLASRHVSGVPHVLCPPHTQVVDEPLYAHHLRLTGAARPYRDLVLATSDSDGTAVMKALLSRTSPTFCKHMAKQALGIRPGLLEACKSVLLIREPSKMLASFARVLPPTLEETGLPSMVSLFSTLRAAGRQPLVILSEDVASHPELTLQLLCLHLGIEFTDRMLSWPAGPKAYDGCWAPWWYGTVHQTTGFVPPSDGPSEPLAPHLAALVEECRPFYNFLAPHALRPAHLAAPVPMRMPTLVDDALPKAAPGAPHHQGATHTYVPDPRNESVLVGIRDGVTGKFELHERQHARVSVLDSGFLLGDGVWEGMRLHKGVLLFADLHLRRLWDGAAAIDMQLGVSREQLLRYIYATISANSMRDGIHIRLMVTRGLKPTPFQDPRCTIGMPTIVVLAEHKVPPRTTTQAAPGLRLATVAIRRGAPDVQDPNWNSHSKLNCIAACIAAAKADADEALMLDPQGFVATCNSTNFLMVRDGELWAPTTRYQMPGITRSVVLKCAREAGIPVRELDFSVSAVYAADEAFVTGTFAGLLPVASVDGRQIGQCSAGALGRSPAPLLPRLQELYAQAMDADVANGP